MKKLILFFLAILTLSITVVANNSPSLLVDNADILTSEEEEMLSEALESTRSTHGIDVVVYTCNELPQYYSPQETADEVYELSGYADDGIMLLLCMGTRDWYVLTSGSAIEAFTDYAIDYMAERFLFFISDGYYYDGFETFNYYCSQFYQGYTVNGMPYDSNNMYEEEFDLLSELICWFIVGMVISLIVTLIMRAQLKSVASQPRADSYIRNGSFALSESKDIFLYRNISRIRRQQNSSSGSSTHRSSSGRSFGGRGGKF